MKQTLVIISLILSSVASICAQESKNEINFAAEEQKQAALENTYKFFVTYRIQAGYMQEWQHSKNNNYPDLYLYGPQIGATFDFNLPYNFTLQTGFIYGLTYGVTNQHWKNMSKYTYEEQIVNHRILSHQFIIPVYVTYNIAVWRKLSIVFYTGPQLALGLAQNDYLKHNLNDETKKFLVDSNVKTDPYERYTSGELIRPNIQYSVGAAVQWDRYRLQGGYNFGLNNLIKQNNNINQHMWNWSWNVVFTYAF